jgi:hypothetical protein
VSKLEREPSSGAWLFPAALAATLVQNYFDLTTLLAGGGLDLASYGGPLWMKLGKDLIYVGIAAAVAWQGFRLRRIPATPGSFAVLVVVAMLIAITLVANGPVIAVIGFRWVLPFLLFLAMGDWAPLIDRRAARWWLLGGVLLCLAAQVYELFHMPTVFGAIFGGLAARTPGIFVTPNSAAFFACASAATIRALEPDDPAWGWAAVLLAFAVSALTQSGTGIIVTSILVLQMGARHRPVIFWAVALGGSAVLFLNLDVLTQRDDYVAVSGGTRLELLEFIVRRSFLSLTHFGVFTNAAYLQFANAGDSIVSDSLVASWMGNFGAMAIPAAVLTGLFVVGRIDRATWPRVEPVLMVFALFAMTTVIFEAFPMNVYLAIGFWAAVGQPFSEPAAGV